MAPSRVASLILLVGVGCLGQLSFAPSAKPDTTAVGHADGQRPSQNGVLRDHELILVVLRDIEAAFSDGDLRRWLSLFHSPFLIMAPEGVIALSSDEEALALIRPQMENLRARGYARSELNRPTVKLLSPTTALAAVEWVRRKGNEEELERLGATYAFFKGDDGWKIVMVTVHSPSTLPELK
jgi:hypothetical protein